MKPAERRAAEAILAREYADPDDDAAIVARAALRLDEHLERVLDLYRRSRATDAPPAGTRLILASENLLEHWGTRTESGRRITVEWGEQRPEGWYEPTFTVREPEQG